MEPHIERSKRILNAAIKRLKPDFIVGMISGGNDSAAAFYVALECGVKFDFIMHGITGTGIPETTDFVRSHYGNLGIPYIEANAGDAYEKYVLRKGFFGRGEKAHGYAYHVLKAGPFRKAISEHMRKGKRDITVMLINGARGATESARRGRTKKHIWNRDPSQDKNIWVNPILHFTTEQRNDFLHSRRVLINPVCIQLDRSGECLCGTMQEPALRHEAAALYPKWGEWLNSLRAKVMAIWPWDWGQDMPKWVQSQKKGQHDMFMPMCVGCERLGVNGENGK